jgi:hypothetical protein
MSLHVGEVHSDVVPVAPPTTPPATPEQELAEKVTAAAQRACWLAERVAAEGFED